MKVLRYLVISMTLMVASCTNPEKKEEVVKPSHEATVDTTKRSPKNYLTDCRKLLANARRMDSTLLEQNAIDNKVANEALVAFTDFAYYCSTDSMRPIYLIKTAQVARAINNIPQAKLALDKCVEDHLNFRDRPIALFMLAQLYDEPSYLNNEHEARKIYQKIIDEYPKSDLARQAKDAMKLLGKSDAEILKDLKKKG